MRDECLAFPSDWKVEDMPDWKQKHVTNSYAAGEDKGYCSWVTV